MRQRVSRAHPASCTNKGHTKHRESSLFSFYKHGLSKYNVGAGPQSVQLTYYSHRFMVRSTFSITVTRCFDPPLRLTITDLVSLSSPVARYWDVSSSDRKRRGCALAFRRTGLVAPPTHTHTHSVIRTTVEHTYAITKNGKSFFL